MMNRSLIQFVAGLGIGAIGTLVWLAARAPGTVDGNGGGADPPVTVLRGQARVDPFALVADADASSDESRSDLVDDATREWALTNPSEFLAYVRSEERIDHLLEGLVSALLVAPEQVLDIAADYPLQQADGERTLEELAIAAVVERDVAAALTHLGSLPSGDRQRRVRNALAEAWARRDPAEAQEWAEGLEPAAPGAIAKVIAATAESDVDAAIRLFEAFEMPAPSHPSVRSGIARPEAIALSIVRQVTSNAERVRLADALLQRRTARSMIALQALATHWSQLDEPAATEWVARNAGRLPAEMPAGVIGELAAGDAVAAASFADQLPADMRVSLAEPIARELARRDPFAAASWIGQFREHPDYSFLYRSVIRSVARTDPAAAAAMLTSTPPAAELAYSGGSAMHLEGDIAEAWAREDPGAATAWVQGIADPAGRASAVNRLAGYWLVADPARAQRMVLGLPQDEMRQEALRNVIGSSITYGHELEPETVRAYGLDAERQAEIGRMLARQDIDPLWALSRAREWISDPVVQRQTVERIEAYLDRYSTTESLSN